MIPLFRPFLRRRELSGVLEPLVEDHIRRGPQAEALEKDLAHFFGCEQGLALRSETLAWMVLQRQLGLGAQVPVAGSWVEARAVSSIWRLLGIPFLGVESESEMSLVYPKTVSESNVWFGSNAWGLLPGPGHFQGWSGEILWDATWGLGGRWDEGPWGAWVRDWILVRLEGDSWLDAGGGCVLLAKGKARAQALKDWRDRLPEDWLLGDLNASLALVQWQDRERILGPLEENQNFLKQALRRHGAHFYGQGDEGWPLPPALPLLIEDGLPDIQQFCQRQGIEVGYPGRPGVFSEEELKQAPQARRSLYRTLLFPCHASLKKAEREQLAKVLGALP